MLETTGHSVHVRRVADFVEAKKFPEKYFDEILNHFLVLTLFCRGDREFTSNVGNFDKTAKKLETHIWK